MSAPTNYTVHELCELAPPMSDTEFEALKRDVREHGIKEPLVVWRGQIIDGRHRYKAVQELRRAGVSIECPAREWVGSDPLHEVISLNMKRRHTEPARQALQILCTAKRFPQLAAAIDAAKDRIREGQKSGGRGKKTLRSRDRKRGKESADVLGELFGISGSTWKRAERVLREAPQSVDSILKGERTVSGVIRELREASETSIYHPYTLHPVCKLMPAIEGGAWEGFKHDIAESGVLLPITIYKGQILDGKERWRAVKELQREGFDIECPVEEYTGDAPLRYCMSMNVPRASYNESQRAVIAVNLNVRVVEEFKAVAFELVDALERVGLKDDALKMLNELASAMLFGQQRFAEDRLRCERLIGTIIDGECDQQVLEAERGNVWNSFASKLLALADDWRGRYITKLARAGYVQ